MSGITLAGRPLRLDRRRRRTIAAVLPGICAVMLHSAVLDLPRADVIDALDADRYRIYWIIGSYLLGAATGMAMTSFWGSRHGLRAVFSQARAERLTSAAERSTYAARRASPPRCRWSS